MLLLNVTLLSHMHCGCVSERSPDVVNCKTTFEGIYHFTYEVDLAGGGICDSPKSVIKACQEPGSRYVDNQVFFMNFSKCADVSSSVNESRFLFKVILFLQNRLCLVHAIVKSHYLYIR